MSGELFLMSPPGPGWRLRGRANFRSQAAGEVDAERAFEEWTRLARAIEASGAQVAVLPPEDGATGLPYCAEAGHPLPPATTGGAPRFLLPNMWAEHRRVEAKLWSPAVAALGFETVSIRKGFWEAQGDVAEFRGTTMLFWGGRTDRIGLDAVRPYFPGDALIIEVRQPAFHGNVAVLALDAVDRLVVCPALIAGRGMDELRLRFGDERLLEITEQEARSYATNALPLGLTLLAPTIVPDRVLAELQGLGMDIVRLPMTELCEKAGGASRCLVCRVPAAIANQLHVPESARLEPSLPSLWP